MAEEKLLGKLILRRVSDCMDDKALQWLAEEVAERNLNAVEISTTVRKVAENAGRKLNQSDAGYIVKRLEEGVKESEIIQDFIRGGKKYCEAEIRIIIENLQGNGFKNNPLRQAYEKEVAGLKKYGEELLADGMPEEQVAQILN